MKWREKIHPSVVHLASKREIVEKERALGSMLILMRKKYMRDSINEVHIDGKSNLLSCQLEDN